MNQSTRARRRTRTVVAAAALAAVLPLPAACGTGTQNSSADTSAAATAKGTTTVTTVSGEKLSVPGDKPAALFFFSVGCGECAGGAKSLNEAAQAYAKAGKKADFLAVDMDPAESKQTIMRFLDYVKAATLPAAIDQDASLARQFKVSALSTLIVVDAQGKVTYQAADPSADQIQDALDKAGA